MAKYPCLQPVNSSMFSRAGYDSENWQLLLEFKSTKEIRGYQHVSPEMGDEALSAPSLGKYFNSTIKGNPGWEYEVLGAEEPDEQPAAKPAVEGGITDDDIRACDPTWAGDQNFQCGTGEMGALYWSKESDPEKWPELPAVPEEAFQVMNALNDGVEAMMGAAPEVDRVDIYSQHPDGTFTKIDGGIDVGQSAMTAPPRGELLGAWTVPESAAEALDLLAEREGEIKAIIAQSKETGEQALTIKVIDANTRLSASDTLTRLTEKKTKTVEALDPFRKVLYDAYSEAGAKVKAGVDPLEKGISHVKSQILSWDQAQERIRQEALRKAREAAEAEARRLQEEEAQRIRLADVQDAIDEGDEQRAQTLFDAPPIEIPRPFVQPQYIPPAAPKVEGQSTSTTWKVDREAVESDETGQAYIVSITKLLTAVKDGKFPIAQAAPLLSWDFSAADKLAGAMQSAFSVPGLTASPKSSLRVGAGRKKKG